jgi:cysteine desulfurase/selenocysteine lyase
VPWQIVCEQTGAKLRVVPINDAGEFLFDEYEKLLCSRTKIVAVGHVSNALGTINPIQRIGEAAHAVGAVILVDGAQAAPHMKLDMRALGVDFYAVSSHKMYGPTGVGVLYGREELLDAMPPYQGGGDMILSVSFEKTLYNDLPFKFEAGTPNIAGGIGLGAAVDYLDQVDLEAAASHEDDVLAYATELLGEIPGLRFIGTAREKTAVLSFTLKGIHPHDTGTILDQEGIAVRTGHHCAQPVMERFGVPATARASFGLYNTRQEAEALAEGIRKVKKVFGA